MPDKDRGLYGKYHVERTDGKPMGWCFVLEDKDPETPGALEYLADKYELRGFKPLADDLRLKAAVLRGKT